MRKELERQGHPRAARQGVSKMRYGRDFPTCLEPDLPLVKAFASSSGCSSITAAFDRRSDFPPLVAPSWLSTVAKTVLQPVGTFFLGR